MADISIDSIKQKYRNIASLPDAEHKLVATRTSDFLYSMNKISELTPTKRAQVEKAVKEGNVLEAMRITGIAGYNGLADGIHAVSGAVESALDSSGMRKFAGYVPGYNVVNGAMDLAGGVVGLGKNGAGLFGDIFVEMLAHKKEDNVRLSREDAETAAAFYAGVIYEKTRAEPSLVDKVKATGESWFNAARGTGVGSWLESAGVWLLQWVQHAFDSSKPQPDFDAIYAQVSEKNTNAASRSYDELLREAQRERIAPEAINLLEESRLVKPSVAKAMRGTGDVAVRRRDGTETQPNGAVGLDGSSEQPFVPAPSPSQARKQEIGKDATQLWGGLKVLGGSVIGTAGALLTLPYTAASGRAVSAFDQAKEGDISGAALDSSVAAAGAVASAKVAQKGLTGGSIFGVRIPGLMQVSSSVLGFTGSVFGKTIEKIGGLPDAIANGREARSLGMAKDMAGDAARAAAKQAGATAAGAEVAAVKAAGKVEQVFAENVATRAAGTNLAEKAGSGIHGFSKGASSWFNQWMNKAADVPIIKPALKAVSVWPAKALYYIGAKTAGTAIAATDATLNAAINAGSKAVNGGVAGKLAGEALERTGFAAAPAAAAAGRRVVPGIVGVGIGSLVVGGTIYASTGDAKAAVNGAITALPGVNTAEAASKGRTAEAWVRGITDAGTGGAIITSPLAVTGIGATIPTALGVGSVVANETLRPIMRAFGADVDPGLIEYTLTNIGPALDRAAAGRKIVETLRANPQLGLREGADPTLRELVELQQRGAAEHARFVELRDRGMVWLNSKERAELSRLAVRAQADHTMEVGLATRFVEEQIARGEQSKTPVTPSQVAAVTIASIRKAAEPAEASQPAASAQTTPLPRLPDSISGGVDVDEPAKRPSAPFAKSSAVLGSIVPV